MGMRERLLTKRKGRKSAHFQAPPIPRNPVGHLREGLRVALSGGMRCLQTARGVEIMLPL